MCLISYQKDQKLNCKEYTSKIIATHLLNRDDHVFADIWWWLTVLSGLINDSLGGEQKNIAQISQWGKS